MEDEFQHCLCREYLGALSERLEEVLPGRGISVRERIEALYPAIIAEHKGWAVDPQSRFHLFMSAVALAAHRVLSEHINDRDILLDILRYAHVEGSRRFQMVAQMLEAMLRKSPDTFRTLVQYTKEIEIERYGKTFVFEHERDDDTCFYSNVTRCFYHDFFKANSASELTRPFCDADEIWMDVLQHGEFGVWCRRPTTIGYGGDKCRFQLVRIGKR